MGNIHAYTNILVTVNVCMFSRHDFGSSLVHGPYSKDLCQEPSIFSEDTFQSAKGGQRRKEENVKETVSLCVINQPFRKST